MDAHVAFLESNLSGTGYEAIETAKRAGHRVSFVTRDLGFYRRGAGGLDESLLDQVIVCDTNDPAAVAAAVRLSGGVDALLTVSEWHVIAAAEAAESLGLVGSSPAAVRAARDKSRTRELCHAAGVPIPAFHRLDRAELPVGGIPMPCVVKPVDEVLSSGVKLCRSAAEAHEHVVELLAGCAQPNDRGQKRTAAVLVEEYLEGPEFSVETLSYDGRTEVLAVTQKLLAPPPGFIEAGHAVPARLEPDVRAACEELVRSALVAIDYSFGAAHVELRLTAGGPRLIEINCRPAGDRITRLVTLSLGADLIGRLIDLHLGRRPRATPALGRGAAIVFLPGTEGAVTAIEGVAAARAMDGVVDLQLYVSAGADHRAAGNNTDRFGHVVAVGPDSAAALHRAQSAASAVRVLVADHELTLT